MQFSYQHIRKSPANLSVKFHISRSADKLHNKLHSKKKGWYETVGRIKKRISFDSHKFSRLLVATSLYIILSLNTKKKKKTLEKNVIKIGHTKHTHMHIYLAHFFEQIDSLSFEQHSVCIFFFIFLVTFTLAVSTTKALVYAIFLIFFHGFVFFLFVEEEHEPCKKYFWKKKICTFIFIYIFAIVFLIFLFTVFVKNINTDDFKKKSICKFPWAIFITL